MNDEEEFDQRKLRLKFDRLFEDLPLITGFALETIRLNNPVTAISARARHDFILTSLNGRFKIKKDDYLLANIIGVMQNPNRLSNADSFDMRRNARDLKRNIFGFGGPYGQKATLENHKCPGQKIAIDFMKMFVLHLTKCDVEPSTSIPLSVVKFVCPARANVCGNASR